MEDNNKRNDEYWNGFGDFGRGHPDDPSYGEIPEEYRSNGMSKAALICGGLSLLSLLFGGAPFFGGLGLLFAFLSRKNRMSRQARTGAVLSSVSLAVFGIMVAISFYTLVSTGVWDHMMEEIREMDPNDPDAVSRIQQDVLQELQRRLLEDQLHLGSGLQDSGQSSVGRIFEDAENIQVSPAEDGSIAINIFPPQYAGYLQQIYIRHIRSAGGT